MNTELNFLKMKDPFREEGEDAFVGGWDRDECPYDEGTDGQFGWRAGWDEANRFDDEG